MMPRLFLITGFALDSRAFSLLHLPENRVRYLDLPEVEPGDTLSRYALRLIDATDYQPKDAIGGVSLGGMLALEIARLRGAASISLLASCTHPRYIRLPFHALSQVAPEAPEPLLRAVFGQIPQTLHRLGMMTEANRQMLAGVMAAFPLRLLRYLPPMIMAWPGCPASVPLHRLHSEGDWMIRWDGQGISGPLVKGRHHLLPVSHPQLCREFLLARLAELIQP
jgi:pimeloyl-ACP methyl ester carboxylesterase